MVTVFFFLFCHLSKLSLLALELRGFTLGEEVENQSSKFQDEECFHWLGSIKVIPGGNATSQELGVRHTETCSGS